MLDAFEDPRRAGHRPASDDPHERHTLQKTTTDDGQDET